MKGMFAGLGVVLVGPVSWLFPEGKQVQGKLTTNQAIPLLGQEVGELYNGFLILPSVEQALAIEGLPFSRENFTYYKYNSLTEIPDDIASHLYLPTLLPKGISPTPSIVIETNNHTFAPRTVSVSYASQNPDNLYLIDVIAQYDFLRPFPIVPGHNIFSSIETSESVAVEKVSFTPQPGLMLPTAIGHVAHWIEDDILYTCIFEFSQEREEVIEFVTSLRRKSI